MPRIVAGVGLLLALAALLDTRSGLGDALSVRLTFTVPEGLVVASAVVFGLAGIVLLAAARGHRKLEEEPEPEREPIRFSWWRQTLTQIALMLPFIAIVAVLWLDGGRIAGALLAWGRGWFQAPDLPAPGVGQSPVVSLPWLGWTFGLVALAVALLTLAIALVLLFAERVVAWLARREMETAEPFVEAVDDSLDDLADESDPRLAIIRCYRRFEAAAARARVRRAPWQTAEEFMQDARRRLPIPDVAVERLTRLFELARFSDHPVRPVERDAARTCLEEIRTALAPKDASIAVA